MLEGMRLAQALGASAAYDAIRGEPADPDRAVKTDDELRAFIRRTADTIFHPMGSCRMGSDAESVVDPALRVRGVTGLRIGPPIDPGVPWTTSLGDPPLALALKSGNFGAPDFFIKAFECAP